MSIAMSVGSAQTSRRPIATACTVALGVSAFVGAVSLTGDPVIKFFIAAVFVTAEFVKREIPVLSERASFGALRGLVFFAITASAIGSATFLLGQKPTAPASQVSYRDVSQYVSRAVWSRTNGCRVVADDDDQAVSECEEVPQRFLSDSRNRPGMPAPVWALILLACQVYSIAHPLHAYKAAADAQWRPRRVIPGDGEIAGPEVVHFSPLPVQDAPSPSLPLALFSPPVRAETPPPPIDVQFEDVVKPNPMENTMDDTREESGGTKYEDLVTGGRFVYGAAAKPQALEYLWPDMLVSGDFNLIGGEGGVGKSSIGASIAATTTKIGATWPTGERVESGSVVICETEDNLRAVTVPRLMAAGANMSRIALCDESIDLAENISEMISIVEALERQTATAVRLIILSPVRQFFGDKESYNDSQVRHRLKMLLAFAEERKICVVGIIHPKPGKEAFAGSEAWKNRARSGIFAKRTGGQGSQRIIYPLKANNGPDDWYIPYETVGATVGEFRTNTIRWGKKVIVGALATQQFDSSDSESANAEPTMAYNAPRAKPVSAKERAMSYLRAALGEGPQDGKVLKDEAARLSPPIGGNTIEEAANELGIIRDQLDETGRMRKANAKTWCTPEQYDAREEKRAGLVKDDQGDEG